MLTADAIVLRAPARSDVETLARGLFDDVDVQMVASARPWTPVSLEARLAVFDRNLTRDPDPSTVSFTVAHATTGEVFGEALLWGIDLHNRLAHLGLSLLPSARNRGHGTAAVRLLCDYGFRVRGLHRLQVDTLARNEPMLRAARAVGFVEEARLRESAWVDGSFVDEVSLGLLAREWPAPTKLITGIPASATATSAGSTA